MNSDYNACYVIRYKTMHKFSYEHNSEHNRSALNPEIMGKIYLEPNYANLAIKIRNHIQPVA